MKNKYVFVLVLLIGILAGSIGLTSLYLSETVQEETEGEISIVTSFYPMYIACLNIVDSVEGVSLQNLSEPQTGCLHDFQMTPEDMKLLSKADVFVVNGGGIESFLEDVALSYPGLTLVEACEELELLEGAEELHEHGEEEYHEHGEEEYVQEDAKDIHTLESAGEHSHNHEENAHAWMSIADYRIMIDTIAKGLAKADPAHKEAYYANAAEYDEKLEKLQQEQQELVQEIKTPVILFHSAYAYVAWDYNFETAYLLDLDEERQVSAGEVAKVLEVIENQDIHLIFAEELYGKSMGDTIQKEVDVTILYLDTLTRGDYDKDSYLNAMRQNMEILKGAGL